MKPCVVALAMVGTPALADTDGYGHMMDWSDSHGIGMMFGPVLWLIVLGLIVLGVIWVVRRWETEAPRKASSTALAELDLRLARGEVDLAEYGEKKKALTT